MDPLLDGFADELVKLARKDRYAPPSFQRQALSKAKLSAKTQGRVDEFVAQLEAGKKRKKRDYATSALLGAVATPLAMMAGGKVQRGAYNRWLKKRFIKAKTPKQKKDIARQIQRGPLLASDFAKQTGRRKPIMTHSELIREAAKGGLMGSAYQALRQNVLDDKKR